jgi:predicted unusual protein kinase regulating ubiquinone biosynthesis (AarF/ABC1/UbiB family)
LLGFIPQDKANLIEDSGIVELLADTIYGAWTGCGGAASINVNKVIGQLQDLTAEKGNLFTIPPSFAYIAKCFSVLEGLGLSNDPKYSIINECLPYISKRLLTDRNERTGAALTTSSLVLTRPTSILASLITSVWSNLWKDSQATLLPPLVLLCGRILKLPYFLLWFFCWQG